MPFFFLFCFFVCFQKLSVKHFSVTNMHLFITNDQEIINCRCTNVMYLMYARAVFPYEIEKMGLRLSKYTRRQWKITTFEISIPKRYKTDLDIYIIHNILLHFPYPTIAATA